MPLIPENKNNFEVINSQVHLKSNYIQKDSWKFKKITGSSFACILGLNKYVSPFKQWMIMTNLYKEPMDRTLADIGNKIEPMIREYVQKQLNIKFKVYNPFQIKFDVFKENKIFGGIPDGEPINEIGEVDYSNNQRMLEIKTTSIDAFVYKKENGGLVMQKDENGYPIVKLQNAKKQEWFEQTQIKIPEAYQLQLALYLYLRNTNKGVFAITFLKKEDYKDLDKFSIEDRETRIINFDINLNSVEKYVNKAKEWYNKHIINGVSPIMTEEEKQWLNEELIKCN